MRATGCKSFTEPDTTLVGQLPRAAKYHLPLRWPAGRFNIAVNSPTQDVKPMTVAEFDKAQCAPQMTSGLKCTDVQKGSSR
jgi:hypothetical protein